MVVQVAILKVDTRQQVIEAVVAVLRGADKQ
jgi:hypothetical protein